MAALVTGIILLLAAGFGTFYSILAVGVSDGPGHLTAQLMLAACTLAALVATVITVRSAWALFARI